MQIMDQLSSLSTNTDEQTLEGLADGLEKGDGAAEQVDMLHQRIAELESENASLRLQKRMPRSVFHVSCLPIVPLFDSHSHTRSTVLALPSSTSAGYAKGGRYGSRLSSCCTNHINLANDALTPVFDGIANQGPSKYRSGEVVAARKMLLMLKLVETHAPGLLQQQATGQQVVHGSRGAVQAVDRAQKLTLALITGAKRAIDLLGPQDKGRMADGSARGKGQVSSARRTIRRYVAIID
jgi:hypothetical protein